MKETWKNIIVKYNETALITTDHILELVNNKELDNSYKKRFPQELDIFKAFNFSEIHEVKVVIIGQDPYHGPNQATGLCFGINENVPIPPSLKNIIKELKNDLNISLTNNSLENWAQQNILMLNASLSVIEKKPNSQATLWSNFTDFIIEEL